VGKGMGPAGTRGSLLAALFFTFLVIKRLAICYSGNILLQSEMGSDTRYFTPLWPPAAPGPSIFVHTKRSEQNAKFRHRWRSFISGFLPLQHGAMCSWRGR